MPEQIPKQHEQLRSLFEKLAAGGQGEAGAVLGQLQELLPEHFAHEELAGGFFDEVLETAPRYAAQVERLRGEHAWALDELASLVARRDYSAGDLAAFARRLQEHEQVENQLLMDALEIDLGVGD